MKISPLQLNRYVVTDVSCIANPHFSPEKEMVGALEQYAINVKVSPPPSGQTSAGHSWSVELEIIQKKKDGENVPYEFRIALVGMFTCQSGDLNTAKENRFVQVNGSSMLYGIAREHIRAITSAGPWGGIIIPTISFYDGGTQPKEEASEQKIQ